VIQTGFCPFVPLCERELAGPELNDAEQESLERHLSLGCPVCEERIEWNLAGGGPDDDPRADVRRVLGTTLARAVDDADAELGSRQALVLGRLDDRLRREEAQRARRIRRRHLRAFFYVTNVAAVLLLVMAYVGTIAAARLQQRTAQALATKTEIQALATALSAYVKEHGQLPPDLDAFVEALGGARAERESPYYYFAEDRLAERDGARVYEDDFGHVYRYRPGQGRALIYSVGPDGEDDQGQDDDLAAWIIFAH